MTSEQRQRLGTTIRLGEFLIDPKSNTLSHGDTHSQLPQKAMEVLLRLCYNADQIISRKELIQDIWEDNYFIGDPALTRSIWTLRQHLLDNPKQPRYIKTIPRKGFQLLIKPEFIENGDGIPPYPPQSSKSLPNWVKFGGPALLAIVSLVAIFTVPAFRGAGDPEPVKQDIKQITTNPGLEYGASFSPDGKSFIYTQVNNDGVHSIFRRTLDDQQNTVERITTDDRNEGAAQWSPDADLIYYIRQTGSSECQVIEYSFANASEREVSRCFTFKIHLGYRQLALSPDGKRLAFLRRNQDNLQVNLIIHELEGGAETILATRDFELLEMLWDQASEKLVINDLKRRLVVWTPETGEQVEIGTQQCEKLAGMSLDPQGRLIFGCIAKNRYSLLAADLTTNTLDEDFPRIIGHNPALSSTGGLLLERSFMDTKIGYMQRDDGGYKYRSLVHSIGIELLPQIECGGEFMTYISNKTRQWGIYRYDFDSENDQLLTEDFDKITVQIISHDSSRIAITGIRSGEEHNSIHIYNMETGKLQRVPLQTGDGQTHIAVGWGKNNQEILTLSKLTDLDKVYAVDTETGEQTDLNFKLISNAFYLDMGHIKDYFTFHEGQLIAANQGEPKVVATLDGALDPNVSYNATGLFYSSRSVNDTSDLMMFQFNALQPESLGKLEKRPQWGMDVSCDAGRIVFLELGTAESDLFFLEL